MAGDRPAKFGCEFRGQRRRWIHDRLPLRNSRPGPWQDLRTISRFLIDRIAKCLERRPGRLGSALDIRWIAAAISEPRRKLSLTPAAVAVHRVERPERGVVHHRLVRFDERVSHARHIQSSRLEASGIVSIEPTRPAASVSVRFTRSGSGGRSPSSKYPSAFNVGNGLNRGP